ncbi:OmpA family protein [Sagittula sp. S175]|uniref:OmpA family protein n=1 Tax=Sagittula sp. S175 TaxID=3415129 RepID=UPI003C7DE8AA
MKAAVLAAPFALIAAPLWAQSTVTLDSFSLDPAPQPALSPEAEMRECLVDPAACDSAEYSGGATFTLDDVVNLGVIDREATPQAMPQPSAETAPIAVTDRSNVDPLPSIDLEILFAYNSDDLTPEAMGKLSALGTALRDPRLSDARLIFIGHTDAVGSVAYNTDLSRRRAESVARFVQGTMGLPPSRLDAVGVGFSRLKNTLDPTSPQNRRVQLVLIPGT